MEPLTPTLKLPSTRDTTRPEAQTSTGTPMAASETMTAIRVAKTEARLARA